MACDKCFQSKDKDGNPTEYCTGMCNVVVIAFTEKAKEILQKGKEKTMLFGFRYGIFATRVL